MRIAIVRLSALGDIIHTASVLQFIKKKIPDIKIDWVVEERFYKILENNPDIDTIIKADLKSIKKDKKAIFKEIKRFKKLNGYDLVIDFQGLIKSAISSRLISKNVAGYDKDSIRESLSSYLYRYKYHIPYHLNTIDRYRLLASYALNIDISKDEVLKKLPYLFFKEEDFKKSKPYFSKDKKNIIFIVGANWQSRIYPKECLLKVANSLDANILIPHANESEQKDAMWLEKKASNIKILPKMDLNELKATISNADLLIGNDTGPSFIAWANNIPSIILFGPTPTSRIYTSKISKTLKSSSKVDPYKLNKNDFSIKEIEPQNIVKLARSLL